jgi:hypothetical protein
MPVRRVVAHPSVEADQGRVALQRGPLVYAGEWPDNSGGRVRNLLLPDDAPLSSAFRPDLLNGVQVVTGRAVALSYDAEGKVTRREQDLTAIPYYAWANRGPGEMVVWIPDRETSARPQPLPTLASRATVTASRGGHDTRAVNDQSEPRSSSDPDSSFFHWWPEKGSTEWIEYAFGQPSRVSEVQVYWFDDTGSGEVPCACILARPLQGWRGMEAGRDPRTPRGREGPVQPGLFQAGDDERPAPRGGPAAGVVGGDPGVEGAVRERGYRRLDPAATVWYALPFAEGRKPA